MTAPQISLIYNPAAGGLHRGTQIVQKMIEALAGWKIPVPPSRIVATQGAGDATTLARAAVAAKMDLIIACGGDGTINEIAQAVIGSNTTLAILPLGTANVLAKELRLPRRPAQLAKFIATGQTRLISVGRASKPDATWSRYFLLMSGIGLDAAIIEAVNPRWKKQWGLASYIAAGLKTLATWRLKSFSVAFGQQEHTATFAIIANAANYAAWFTIAPRSQMESEHLNVCIFNAHSRLVYLSYAFLSLFGAHTISPFVIYEPITKTTAQSSQDTPVQLDGELVGYLPMQFECVPHALKIVAAR